MNTAVAVAHRATHEIAYERLISRLADEGLSAPRPLPTLLSERDVGVILKHHPDVLFDALAESTDIPQAIANCLSDPQRADGLRTRMVGLLVIEAIKEYMDEILARDVREELQRREELDRAQEADERREHDRRSPEEIALDEAGVTRLFK